MASGLAHYGPYSGERWTQEAFSSRPAREAGRHDGAARPRGAGRRDRALLMTENPARQAPAEPIAIVGLACRFPEATGPAEFLELVLTGRRAFRRMPPARLDVSEYGDDGPGPDGVDPAVFGSVRAGLLEGWRFDRAAYGVTLAAYQAADPAHWLALETAAQALADGGFPGGQGLTRDRTGVIIGTR
jgi:acyl transferase domain-containing protein